MTNIGKEGLAGILGEQLNMAQNFQVTGKWIEAEAVLTNFLELIGKTEVDALNQRGLVNRMLLRYADAEDDFLSAMGLALDRGNQEAELTAVVGLIDIYRTGDRDPNFDRGQEQNFSQAQSYMREAEVLMTRMSQEASMAKVNAFINFGLLHDNMGEPQRALVSYGQAETAIRNLLENNSGNSDFQNRLARTLTNKGVAQERVGDLVGAQSSQTEALDIYLRLRDLRGIGNAKISLGDVLNKMGKQEEARVLYEQAKEDAKRETQIVDQPIFDLASSRLKQMPQ